MRPQPSTAEDLRREAARLADAGRLRAIEPSFGRDFTTNDYLALSRDPRVAAAAKDAIDRYGAGAPAARLLGGDRPPHGAAERAAAEWRGAEAALLFTSGWHANVALLASLARRGDALVCDELNHASLVDGARLSRARTLRFRHGDLDDLERRLAEAGGARRRFVVLEHVHSMEGDVAPIDAVLAAAGRHGAEVLLDEAHAAGVLPPAPPHPRLLARMATGGKALGVSGAFVCGPRALIDHLVNAARTFLFTTAVPPATAAALLAAIAVARAEPERAGRALAAAARLRARLAARGLAVRGATPIASLVVGSDADAVALATAVRARGFDVRAVRPPTVPEGTARIRMICHADHRDEEVDALADAVADAADAAATASSTRRGSGAAGPIPAERDARDALYVLGTDTGIGKTLVSALLARAARRAGRDARYLKPLQTGADSDTDAVRALVDARCAATPPVVSLALPASVDQAAAAEGVDVRADDVAARVASIVASAPGAAWILEAAGGVRVPLNDDEDQADLVARLGCDAVLVARSGLGTLNHTLLSVEALAARRIRLRALVLSGPRHAANVRTLRARLAIPIFELPPLDPADGAALERALDAASGLADLFR